MKNLNPSATTKSNALDRLKNVFIAAVIFGSLGAYAGIHTMYNIDARTDDRINAALKANHPTPTVTPLATPASK